MGADPISAGISAAGSIAGAVVSGKGAKKAAKVQQQTTQMILDQTKQYYNDAVARYQPDIDQGNAASQIYAGLLGDGGDAAASANALQTFRNSDSYQDTMDTALAGVNANAYAAGMGRSGAAYKALQAKATDLSNASLQNYLSNVNTQVQTGANAKASLTGAGTNALSTSTTATQAEGTAQANADIASAAGWSKALGNSANDVANAYKSSYGG